MENWGSGEYSQVELQKASQGKCREIYFYLEYLLHVFIPYKV